jgi:hypothetical protein
LSQLTVEWVEYIDQDLAEAAALLAYLVDPYPRTMFSLQEYTDHLVQELVGLPALCVFSGKVLVAAHCLQDSDADIHVPGTVVTIHHTIADPLFPEASRILQRQLFERLKAIKASWVRTTRRVSLTEFKSRIRRVPYGRFY